MTKKVYANLGNHQAKKQMKKITPQSMAIPGRESEMKRNNAGGITFVINQWKFLDRFLIIGSEGGTYYAGERALTIQNANNVIKCIAEDGRRVVDRIVEISDSGRAPKNSPAIFALALCMCPDFADVETRRYAAANLSKVARIGTHVLEFADILSSFRGWGKLGKRAIAVWFENKSPLALSRQAVKYTQRNSWALKDLLRLSHPTSNSPEMSGVLQFIAHPEDLSGNKINIAPRPKMVKKNFKWVETEPRSEVFVTVPDYLAAANELHKLSGKENLKKAIQLITEFEIPREVVPTEYLNIPEIWEAMLPSMGLTALIRNLGKMTSINMLKPLGNSTKFVCSKLIDDEIIKHSRVHPVQYLMAYKTYKSGGGWRGNLQWKAVEQIVDALEKGFYASFNYVEPTNKNFYLGIDVSGSMTSLVANGQFSAAEIATAMAMTTVKTEPFTYTMGFAHYPKDLKISANDNLQTALKKTHDNAFGRTYCALPMLDAIDKKLDVDVFIVYTDSETYVGRIHPSQALKKYREYSGHDAKLIVVGITATQFTIADPKDPGMLDVVGFDSSVPQIISGFVK